MRLFVPLTQTEFDALRDLAQEERRRPQDQAAAMLGTALTGRDTPPPRPAPVPMREDDGLPREGVGHGGV